MGSTQGSFDKSVLERQWSNHEARSTMGREDRLNWDRCRYVIRPHMYFDKVLIVWSMQRGQPQVKEVLKVVSIDLSFQDGIWLSLEAKIAKRAVSLTHTPRRILDYQVYGWVPFFNEMRYAGPDWSDPGGKRNMRLTACFRMLDCGDKGGTTTPEEGLDFLSEMHVFRELWPEYADTRF